MSKTIATSAAAVAILGLVAMSFVSAIPAAHADMTTAQMEALITQLQAQLAALTGGTTTTTTATFTTDLTTGSTGADVTALQNWLIGKGFSIPAGATGYFGTQTVAALAAYQASVGITPAAGYFGPITRAKVNASGSMTTGGTTTTGTTGLTGTGEGYLDKFTQLSEFSAESVGESETKEVVGASVRAQDSDQSIDRVTVTIGSPSGSGSTTLSKYISSVSVLLDGKTIGTMDVSDGSKNGSGSNSVYTFRFTGLGGIVKEGDTSDLTIAVTGVDSIDSANDTTEWTVDMPADSIRAVSPNGVSDTYGSDINTKFTVEKFASANSVELKASLGDNNLDSQSVAVDDTNDTDGVELLQFSLKANGSDMNITSLPITLTSTGAGLARIANKLNLKVNGDTYTEIVSSTTAMSGDITFDNLDLNVSEGDTLDFTVTADINNLDSYFTQGDTLMAALDTSNIEATDQSDTDIDSGDLTGSATGNAMSFYETGVAATYESSSTSIATGNSANDDAGTFTIKYRVSAFGGDVYVSTTATATLGSVVANASVAPTTFYEVDNASGSIATASSTGVVTVSKVSGSVTTQGNGYKIAEGSTAELTLTVTHTDTSAAADAGLFRAKIDGIQWSTVSSTDNSTAQLYNFNLDDYKTDYISLN